MHPLMPKRVFMCKLNNIKRLNVCGLWEFVKGMYINELLLIEQYKFKFMLGNINFQAWILFTKPPAIYSAS